MGRKMRPKPVQGDGKYAKVICSLVPASVLLIHGVNYTRMNRTNCCFQLTHYLNHKLSVASVVAGDSTP